MKNSTLAQSVLNNITSKTISSCGDLPPNYTGPFEVCNSNFQALASEEGAKEFEIKTIITSAETFSNINGSTVAGSWQYTIPNDNTYHDGTYYSPQPYIGDPVPFSPFSPGGYPVNPPPFAPAVFPSTGQIKIVPDLEQLEEGVHDIKGGKIIIKKIKITEEQIETALEEELGHKPTDEEKQKLKEDLEALSASEERDV